MSKPETNIVSVPLANAYLNLNQEKDEVRNYDGFNKLNAPFYGGNLTPLWRKFLGRSKSITYTDSEGSLYKIEDGIFSKITADGTEVVIKDDFEEYSAQEEILSDRVYKWYYDENNKIYLKSSDTYVVVLGGIIVKELSNYEGILFHDFKAILISSDIIEVYKDSQLVESFPREARAETPSYTIYEDMMVVNINHSYFVFDSENNFVALDKLYKSADEIAVDYIDVTSVNVNGPVTSALNTQLKLQDVETNSIINAEYSDVSSQGAVYQYTDSYYKKGKKSSKISFANNSFSESIILSPYTKPICNSAVMCVTVSTSYITGDYVREDSPYNPPTGMTKGALNCKYYTTAFFNAYKIRSVDIDSIDLENKVIFFAFTLEKSGSVYPIFSGVYFSSPLAYDVLTATRETAPSVLGSYNKYSDLSPIHSIVQTLQIPSVPVLMGNFLESYNMQWFDWATSCSLTVGSFSVWTDTTLLNSDDFYNLNSSRGFAYNLTDNFRLLLNAGEISAVSITSSPNKLGTLISNFGINDILSVYIINNTRLVYTDGNNKVHIVTLDEFRTLCSMNVILDRYFIFNATGVNCYDLTNNVWFKIGIDWNNRFLLDLTATGTKLYSTSAMYRTTDNNPMLSMLFGVDYYNQIPIAGMTPQYAEGATIQLYGTSEVTQDVLYNTSFVYSDGAWTSFIQEEYSGTTAETQSDNNLLIPTSLFTQFVTSYLNDIYAVIYNGFTPLYKNNNSASTIKFNFYLGSLITDLGLDAVFILQGQYYRLSNKIIYSYNYSNGVISDTQEICNVGTLSFVGASPSEAFFWSYANRTLYKFTGARTVESIICADSINAIYSTLYDTTTSSLYISTDRGLIVYNAFGNFIIEDIKLCTALTSSKFGISYQLENGDIYGLYYNAVDGEDVIPVTLETAFYGASTVQNVINDTLYVKIFNKDKLSKGVVKFGGYIQQNYGETKELVSKTIEVTSSQFDKNTNVLLLRYQPDKQRGIGISWKIESDFPISFVGVGASQTSELNVPKGNSPVMTAQKYNI